MTKKRYKSQTTNREPRTKPASALIIAVLLKSLLAIIGMMFLMIARVDKMATSAISENKELVESKTSTGYSGVFRLSFTVDDVVRDYSVATPFGVNLIVMGTVQSMGSGCMCAPNAVVRALLRHLIVERNEVVILDMEAGVEHIGRGTAQRVDALLIVADANLKALEIAKHIHDLAAKAGMKQIFLVGNRVMDAAQKEAIENFAEKNGLAVLAFVPFDQKIIEAEMRGETPLNHKEIAAVQAIDNMCEALAKKNI